MTKSDKGLVAICIICITLLIAINISMGEINHKITRQNQNKIINNQTKIINLLEPEVDYDDIILYRSISEWESSKYDTNIVTTDPEYLEPHKFQYQ